MKRLVTIASGKGGVGKTCFAIGFSHALAQMGRRILLIDGDIGLANVDVQLGLANGDDLGRALLKNRSISASIQTVEGIGLDVLLGQSGSGTMGVLDPRWAERLIVQLQTMNDKYDLIVIDLPSGIDRGLRQMMSAADDSIIVTTEEPTALTDAYALIKTIRKHDTSFLPKVVVNLVRDHQAGQRTFEGFSRVCGRFLNMTPLGLGAVRRDRHVIDAIGRQTPLLQCYPNCSAAKDIIAVAETFVTKAPMR